MAASILEPGMGEAVSADVIVLDNNDEQVVTLYTDTGEDIPYGVVIELQRLTVAGNYEDVSTTTLGKIVMTKDTKSILITGIGTYRLSRPDISKFEVNVGAQVG